VTVEAPISADPVYSAANVPVQALTIAHFAFACLWEGASPNSNGTRCLCDPGWEMRSDSAKCTRCSNGYFKLGSGDFECTPCSDDTAQMSLMDTEGRIGSLTRDACLCKPSNYRNVVRDVCVPCEEGALCPNFDTPLDQVLTAPGYWRAGRNETQFYTCPFPKQCIGGLEPEQTCSAGTSGPLCNTCKAGYGRRTGCELCSGDSTYVAVTGVGLQYLTILVAYAAASASCYKHEESNTCALMKVLISFLFTNRALISLRDEWPKNAPISTIFKILGSFSTVAFGDMEIFDCFFSMSKFDNPSDGVERYVTVSQNYALLPLPLFLLPTIAAAIRWHIVKPKTAPHPSAANYDEIVTIVPGLQDQLIAVIVVLAWYVTKSICHTHPICPCGWVLGYDMCTPWSGPYHPSFPHSPALSGTSGQLWSILACGRSLASHCRMSKQPDRRG